MQSDVVTGLELVCENAIENFRGLIGPTDSKEAKQQDQRTIRGIFGTDNMRNAIHGSQDSFSFHKEHNLYFSK